MLRVPSASVNWPFCVRSSFAVVIQVFAAMLIATKMTTARPRAAMAWKRREMGRIGSAALLQVDDDHIGRQEQRDQREEIDDVAQVDHAGRNRREMGEEAERRDRVHQR